MALGDMHRGDGDRTGELLARAVDSLPARGDCPTPEEVAALLDGTLSGTRRETVMGHLASCDRCREVYAVAAGIGEPEATVARPVTESSHGWRFGWLTPYAVAAGLVLSVVSGVLVYNEYSSRSGLDYYASMEQSAPRREAAAELEKAAPVEEAEKDVPGLRDEMREEQAASAGTRSTVPGNEAAGRKKKSDFYRTAPAPSVADEPAVASADKYAPRPQESAARLAEVPPGKSELAEPVIRQAEAMPAPPAAAPAPPAPATAAVVPQETYTASQGGRDAKSRGDSAAELRKRRSFADSDDYGGGMMAAGSMELPNTSRQAPAREEEAKPRVDERASGTAGYAKEIVGGEGTAGADTGFAAPNTMLPPGSATVQTEMKSYDAAAEPARYFKVKGILKSIDIVKGEIELLPLGESETMKLKADPEDLKGLSTGDDVMVQYEKGKVYFVRRIKKARTITVPVGC